ncbi:hypothetical protein MKZ38_008465 [Zalerion maritima]|uniref:F-box domain-containing protein n=1 Tax=Zalerion maritima TaxID=339359 RepID=A0AAD5RU32_9PEZI|nr:hypothetical protein MKZ38_008465 [Zalerion maritima]
MSTSTTTRRPVRRRGLSIPNPAIASNASTYAIPPHIGSRLPTELIHDILALIADDPSLPKSRRAALSTINTAARDIMERRIWRSIVITPTSIRGLTDGLRNNYRRFEYVRVIKVHYYASSNSSLNTRPDRYPWSDYVPIVCTGGTLGRYCPPLCSFLRDVWCLLAWSEVSYFENIRNVEDIAWPILRHKTWGNSFFGCRG